LVESVDFAPNALSLAMISILGLVRG